MVSHALDEYYVSITLLANLAVQASLFALCWTFKTDKFTDFAGGLGFFTLAFLTFFMGASETYHARNIIATVFVLVWSVRLGGFLLFRVLKMGKDSRFDEIRVSDPQIALEKSISPTLRLLGWAAVEQLSQVCWILGLASSVGLGRLCMSASRRARPFTSRLNANLTTQLPLTILNSPRVSDPASGGGRLDFGTAGDIIGIILFVIGFALEATADQTKWMFKQSKPPKGAIIQKGPWKYCRHPNYTGEIILWWGIYALCVSPATHNAIGSGGRRALIASVVGPIFITLLLMFASGIPTAEKPTAKKYFLMSHGNDPESGDKWAEYKAYLNRTSILFPIPPSVYRPLPGWFKQTVLLDLPMYKFDEDKDGKEALEEQRKQRREEA